MNFQMFKLVLEKTEKPEIKLPASTGSWEKQAERGGAGPGLHSQTRSAGLSVGSPPPLPPRSPIPGLRGGGDPGAVGNLISGSSAFSKSSLNIRKFTVHVLLKPGLENFEHYFTSM